MNHLARLYWTAKGVGWDNLPRRLLQAFRVRSGLLRKRLSPERFSEEAFKAECTAAVAQQGELWAERAKRFFPPPPNENLQRVCGEEEWAERVKHICQKALDGEYLFFSKRFGQTGWPPDFNRDSVHDLQWEAGRHWLDGPDSLGGKADIKFVWEPSRFSLAYYFARAYARSGEERWAKAFWEMFDAWAEQNPPQLSVAWRCGQEMTFRLMAMLFGAFASLESPSTTNERLHALSRLAWQTGKHISININAACSQGNNHGISEAVGLWTVGLLFPEFKEAGKWRRRGRKILAAEVKRQIYDDGSYVQHSLNYHRVMMDDLLWACRLAQLNDEQLPPVIYDRFERATKWLVEMIDSISGRVPNYGANDGALVLPLSTCDYLDYRSVAQAAHYLLHRKRCFEPGPWDEKMLRLFGPESLDAPVQTQKRKSSFAAPNGGYYILRGPDSHAMTRCHSYRDRPGQCDMLHVDLWMGGVNVLRDAGSYMYNCEQPWQHYFPSTAAHNTVEIDGADQMVKGPRFLWFKWTESHLLRFETSDDGRVGFFEGEHYGYRRLPGRVVHRRSICRIDDTYIIIDDILGSGEHEIALRWRLCQADWREEGNTCRANIAGREITIAVHSPDQMSRQFITDQETLEPEGWESLYYGQKTQSPTVIATGLLSMPTSVITVVRLKDHNLAVKHFDPTRPESAILLTGHDYPELASEISRLSGGRMQFD